MSTNPTHHATPRSQHVSDSPIQVFLQPDFDPASYLNATLPTLSLSSAAPRFNRTVALPELSTQLQTVLAQLNAQTTRLSNTLTQLTDEIIRSGSRLAYEVEVLRGETGALTDALDNGLKRDLVLLAPSIQSDPSSPSEQTVSAENGHATDLKHGSTEVEAPLERLRTLTTVRERLDTVIRTFGSAMQWPLAPSEISLAASLISVSAPEPSTSSNGGRGTAEGDGRSREEKGKAYMEQLRAEIQTLLSSRSGNAAIEGIEAATARVAELRSLADVWRGTAEGKARVKQVEGLQKVVDDELRAREKAGISSIGGGARKPGVSSSARGYDYRYGDTDPSRLTKDGGGAYAFLQNLRNLKNDVYLE